MKEIEVTLAIQLFKTHYPDHTVLGHRLVTEHKTEANYLFIRSKNANGVSKRWVFDGLFSFQELTRTEYRAMLLCNNRRGFIMTRTAQKNLLTPAGLK